MISLKTFLCLHIRSRIVYSDTRSANESIFKHLVDLTVLSLQVQDKNPNLKVCFNARGEKWLGLKSSNVWLRNSKYFYKRIVFILNDSITCNDSWILEVWLFIGIDVNDQVSKTSSCCTKIDHVFDWFVRSKFITENIPFLFVLIQSLYSCILWNTSSYLR